MTDQLLRTLLCGDPEMPEAIRPLSWLKSMIEYCREHTPKEPHEDADAYWMMVQEVEQLYENAQAALTSVGERNQ